jgi:hypothetical protein
MMRGVTEPKRRGTEDSCFFGSILRKGNSNERIQSQGTCRPMLFRASHRADDDVGSFEIIVDVFPGEFLEPYGSKVGHMTVSF